MKDEFVIVVIFYKIWINCFFFYDIFILYWLKVIIVNSCKVILLKKGYIISGKNNGRFNDYL